MRQWLLTGNGRSVRSVDPGGIVAITTTINTTRNIDVTTTHTDTSASAAHGVGCGSNKDITTDE